MIKNCLGIGLLCVATAGTAQKRCYSGDCNLKGIIAYITITDSVVNKPPEFEIACGGSMPPDTTSASVVRDSRGNELLCNIYDSSNHLLLITGCQYDTCNNRTEWTAKKRDGSLGWHYEYVYDAKGCPATTVIHHDKDRASDTLDLRVKYRRYKYICYYNLNGAQVKNGNYGNDDSISWWGDCAPPQDPNETRIDTGTTFDSLGRKIVTVSWQDYGFTWRIVSLYNQEGNEVETDGYDGSGMKCRITRNEYDRLGNLLVAAFYDNDAGVEWPSRKDEYQYDFAGRKTQLKTYGWHHGWDLCEEMLYDSSANVVQLNWYSQGKMLERTAFSYDARGNKLHEVNYDGYDRIKREEFNIYERFDSHGNWLKRVQWAWNADEESKNIPDIAYRVIEYYK